MDRWWTDPQVARSTLERVDDSDPVQGVGTAVLGYHGLAEGVLRPLTERTLLDVEGVSKALDGLDIAPVAQALANATRPVVGDGADKYGELLAKALHQDAVESTGRLILNLVSTGMAWPTAIDRAASVHGVPVDRLGKAGAALRAPALAKIAQADIADRALMEYAAHVGKREYAPEVVSKAYREREFREELVNRDALGRFSDKPDRSLSGMSAEAKSAFLERQARREKRQRRNERNKRRAAEAPSYGSLLDALVAREPEKKSLADMGREAKKESKDDLDAAFDRIANRVLDRAYERLVDRTVQALLNRKKTEQNGDDFEIPDLMEVPNDIPLNGDYYPGWVGGSSREQQFVLVNKDVAEMAAKAGGFNWAKLQDSGMVFGLEPMDREMLRLAILDYSRLTGDIDPLSDVAIIAFDGLVAYDEDYTANDKTYLADAGVYSVSRRNEAVGIKGLEFDDYLDLQLQAYSVPGMSSGPKVPIQLPHLTVKLENEKEFMRLPGDGVRKADRLFRESDVVRDELGRFAEEGGGERLRTPEERRARREKRQRRQQRNAARLAALQAPQPSLVDALLAREERPQVVSNTNFQTRRSTAEQELDDAWEKLSERAADRALNRLLDRAQSAVQERQKNLESFRNAHEEWRQTKAVRFSNEDDLGTFTEIFDYDPYTGKELGLGGVTDDFERREAIEMLVTPRLRPTQDLIEGMYYRPDNPMVGEPLPADVAGKVANIAETPWAALAFAQASADDMNREMNDQTREYMPMVQFDNEHRQFPMYRPMIVEVLKRDEDVVVLGSDADWAALKRGDKVKLEPLPGYNDDPEQPGQGKFKELFYAVGSNESVGRDSELHEKSDFYVRAFRIVR